MLTENSRECSWIMARAAAWAWVAEGWAWECLGREARNSRNNSNKCRKVGPLLLLQLMKMITIKTEAMFHSEVRELVLEEIEIENVIKYIVNSFKIDI